MEDLYRAKQKKKTTLAMAWVVLCSLVPDRQCVLEEVDSACVRILDVVAMMVACQIHQVVNAYRAP